MSNCNDHRECPICGDKLIHQNNSQPDESSSGYGQHIHDDYPCSFFWIDSDGMIKKNMTGVFRIIEHKFFGQEHKKSQRQILPLLAIAVEHLVDEEIVDKQSGVFTVYCDPPYDGPLGIRKVLQSRSLKLGPEIILQGQDKITFETGGCLSRDRWAEINDIKKAELEMTPEQLWDGMSWDEKKVAAGRAIAQGQDSVRDFVMWKD